MYSLKKSYFTLVSPMGRVGVWVGLGCGWEWGRGTEVKIIDVSYLSFITILQNYDTEDHGLTMVCFLMDRQHQWLECV